MALVFLRVYPTYEVLAFFFSLHFVFLLAPQSQRPAWRG